MILILANGAEDTDDDDDESDNEINQNTVTRRSSTRLQGVARTSARKALISRNQTGTLGSISASTQGTESVDGDEQQGMFRLSYFSQYPSFQKMG